MAHRRAARDGRLRSPGWIRAALVILALGACDRGPTPPVTAPPAVAPPAPPRAAIAAALDSAETLLATERLDDALAVAETLAERAPEHWPAQELLARVLAAQALRAEARGED